MPAVLIDDIGWYTDTNAVKTGEPGIRHSYMAGVATTLNHIAQPFDPVWLMGAGGFAFRIMINETMCPSAMSVFNWRAVLPEVIEQAGYRCLHLSRLWDEEDQKFQRQRQAHEAIVGAIDRGVPSVVWDVCDSEWGVIIGYDSDKQSYVTLTHKGRPSSLPFDKLGQNGIDILSVIIPQEPNDRSKEEVVLNALTTAVAHAEQKEWTDRPGYQNGLAAYDYWALMFERWAMIVNRDDPDRIGADICTFAQYNAGHYYGARCYAREFLNNIAGRNAVLHRAASCYGSVASSLEPVWKNSPKSKKADPKILIELSLAIKEAKAAEEEGIAFLREYVQSRG